jgi:hypothetical protein
MALRIRCFLLRGRLPLDGQLYERPTATEMLSGDNQVQPVAERSRFIFPGGSSESNPGIESHTLCANRFPVRILRSRAPAGPTAANCRHVCTA